jgi:hypothetical protein
MQCAVGLAREEHWAKLTCTSPYTSSVETCQRRLCGQDWHTQRCEELWAEIQAQDSHAESASPRSAARTRAVCACQGPAPT